MKNNKNWHPLVAYGVLNNELTFRILVTGIKNWVNRSIKTWSAPKYSQESQNEIWHHTKGTSTKTVEI